MEDRRFLWLAIGAIAYVCFAALKEAGHVALSPLVALVGLPAVLFELWRRTGGTAPGEYRIQGTARASLRAAVFGASLWLAARTGAPGSAGLDAAANLGVGVAAVAALVALARIAPVGGLLSPQPGTQSLDAAGFAALLWGIAVAIPATRALGGSGTILLDPLAIDYATTTASVGTLLVLVAASARIRIQRRLEIGVADRANGALALCLTALFVSLPAAAANIAAPDRVLPLAVLAAALACTWVVTTREPTTVSIALRGVLAVMLLGVPAVLLTAIAAREAPEHAPAVTLFGGILAIAIGAVSRAVARPLGPEQSRFLTALDAASRATLLPEPDAALRAALLALRATATTPSSQAEIFRVAPPESMTVDVAGNVRTDTTEAPSRLYEIAAEEPERTLRAEVLTSLVVRRPDVRSLAAWFDTRRVLSATLIADDEGPLGLILLPRGRRKKAMTLEEARAVRTLADRLGALLSVSTALARARERETLAARRSEELEGECRRLERVFTEDSARHRAHAARLARPVRSSAYGAAARFALEQLEKVARHHDTLRLVVPPGVDAIAWTAAGHLESPRSGGPLVVADATAASDRNPDHFRGPDSPLAAAEGGTLLLLDAAALPLATQEAIVEVLARGRASTASNVPRTGLIVSCHEPLSELTRAGRVSRAFLTWLGTAEVRLPSLAERPEDLRALVLDHLSGLGLRLRGEPLGVEPPALAAILDHHWPGNDAELRDVLSRAAQTCRGPVITVPDLTVAGFRPAEDVVQLPPPPASARRRPRATSSSRRR